MPNLFIDVQARFAQFQDGLNKIQRDTQKFSNDLQGAFRKVSTSLATIGVGFGIGTVSVAFRQAMEAANEAEKASNKLNATLRSTGFSAGLTKAEIDDLADALSRSTQFDDESIRNAASELLVFRNVQGKVFEETLALSADVAAALGTNVPEAAARLGRALEDPDTAFGLLRRQGILLTEQQKDVIKALGETGDKAGQQRIILDRLQQAYGGLAREMNTGINKATSDVKKSWDELMETLGKTSAVEGGTTRTLGAISGYLDGIKATIEEGTWTDKLASILTLGVSSAGRGDVIRNRAAGRAAGTASPERGVEIEDQALTAAFGAAMQRQSAVEDAEYQKKKKREEELKKAREAAAKTAEALVERYVGQLRGLQSQIRNVQGAESELANVRAQFADEKGPISPRARALQQEIIAVATQLDKARELKKSQEEEKRLLEEGNKGWVAYAEAVFSAADAENEVNASLVKSPKQLKDIADNVKSAIDPTFRFKQEWLDLADAMNQGFLTEAEIKLYKLDSRIRSLIQPTDNLFEAIQKAWEQGDITDEQMERAFADAVGELDKGTEKTNDFAHAIGTAFEDAILRAKGFKDVLRGLAEDIARIALRMTVTKPLENALGQLFSVGLSGLFGGAGTQAPAPVSNAVPWMAPGRAGGGSVSAMMPYLVGEHGPELFVPGVSGGIVPNEQLMGAGINYSPVYNFNGQAPNRSEVQMMINAGNAQTMRAIPDLMRRGGNFSSTVRGR